jgi:endogenous inhibitor of DNA gyrase (YacG/DUF329 family)
MALIKCPECSKEISGAAKSDTRPCIHPGCKGTQIRKQFPLGSWYWIWRCDKDKEHRNLELK